MKSAGWLLLHAPDGWELHDADQMHGSWGADTFPPPREVGELIARNGGPRQGLVIGCGALDCMAASIPAAGTRPGDRQALAYVLEERIPWPAEEFVADYVMSADGRDWLAVAVRDRPWRTWIDELETAGLRVVSVTPATMLAAAAALDLKWRGEEAQLWQVGDVAEGVFLRDGRPRGWICLPARGIEIGRWLRRTGSVDAPPRVSLRGLSGEARDRADWGPAVQATEGETGWIDDVRRGAQAILARGQAPWFELRREGLAPRDPWRDLRRPVGLAASGVAACLLLGSLGYWIESRRYEGETTAAEAQQVAAFRRAFPEQPPPRGIVSRLQSEHARSRAITGQGSAVLAPVSAVALLHQALDGLPTGVRLRLLEIRVESGRIQLTGEVRSHGDGERIAESLRGRGFEVDPPETRQLPSTGVSIHLTARLPATGNLRGGA
jgi:type II secretory pathway component PulL